MIDLILGGFILLAILGMFLVLNPKKMPKKHILVFNASTIVIAVLVSFAWSWYPISMWQDSRPPEANILGVLTFLAIMTFGMVIKLIKYRRSASNNGMKTDQ